MKALMLKAFEAWKSGKPLDPLLFQKGFVYKGASQMINADVWLSLPSNEHMVEEVELLYVVSDSETGALLFEWVDAITLLKYRTSWFFKFAEGAISELIETKESIEAQG